MTKMTLEQAQSLSGSRRILLLCLASLRQAIPIREDCRYGGPKAGCHSVSGELEETRLALPSVSNFRDTMLKRSDLEQSRTPFPGSAFLTLPYYPSQAPPPLV